MVARLVAILTELSLTPEVFLMARLTILAQLAQSMPMTGRVVLVIFVF